MNKPKSLIPMLVLSAAVCGVLRAQAAPQTGGRESVLERCERAEDVAVRFYYNPMINQPNVSPGPLIVLPVSTQDPQVGTKSGWLLRVTLSDLRDVLRTLGQSKLDWKDSDSPKQLVVEPFGLPQPHHHTMEVAVSSPAGSATAEVDAKQACGLLSDVSKSLSSSKARNAVSFYAGTVSCPGSANKQQ
jgi:hypothetical protein